MLANKSIHGIHLLNICMADNEADYHCSNIMQININ